MKVDTIHWLLLVFFLSSPGEGGEFVGWQGRQSPTVSTSLSLPWGWAVQLGFFLSVWCVLYDCPFIVLNYFHVAESLLCFVIRWNPWLHIKFEWKFDVNRKIWRCLNERAGWKWQYHILAVLLLWQQNLAFLFKDTPTIMFTIYKLKLMWSALLAANQVWMNLEKKTWSKF